MSDIDPELRRRLVALGNAHDEWVDGKLATDPGPFRPEGRKPGSDYNQHHVDLEADDDAFHDRARQIMGGN